MSSTDQSNQLRLHHQTLITNWNLVNMGNEPKPIQFQNASHRHLASSISSSNGEFRYINENKLEMYTFLAQRKLQSQEWRGKYLNELIDEIPQKDTNSQIAKPAKNPKAPEANAKSNPATPRQRPSTLHIITIDQQKLSDLKNLLEEMKCSIDSLEKVLNEYSNVRLKFDCNDAVEEEKRVRLQNEQIKNTSRLIYNFHNQLTNLSKSPTDSIQNKNQLLSRVVNIQRYILKALDSFNAAFPYRTDASIKFFSNLFKHLHAAISDTVSIYSAIDASANASPLTAHINQKLRLCHNLIDELNTKEIKSDIKKVVDEIKVDKKKPVTTKPKQQGLNKVSQKPIAKKPIPKKKVLPKATNEESEAKVQYVNRMVKTARLFPSKFTIEKRTKSSSPSERNPTSYHQRDVSPTRPHSARAESHEHEIRHPNDDSVYYEPALHHISSPYLSKIGYRSRSISPEKGPMKRQTYQNFVRQSQMDHDERMLSPRRQPARVNHRDNIRKTEILNLDDMEVYVRRLDAMKGENDALRLKYDKLKYTSHIPKKTIPYAELYLKVDANENEKNSAEFIGKRLRKASKKQMSDIMSYREQYEKYVKNSAISLEGNSEEGLNIFERVSNDLFDDCFKLVCVELESVSSELSELLLNAEFVQN